MKWRMDRPTAFLARSLVASRATWEQCFAKLDEFRTYGEDRDGQGAAFGKPAVTITSEVIDSVVALLMKPVERSMLTEPVLTP